MASYPDGGVPPQVTTTTSQPAAPVLPYTGGESLVGVSIGLGAVIVGCSLLYAVANFGRKREFRGKR